MKKYGDYKDSAEYNYLGNRNNMKSSLQRSPYLYRPRPPSNRDRMYSQDKYNPGASSNYSHLRKDNILDRYKLRGTEETPKLYGEPSHRVELGQIEDRSHGIGGMEARARMINSNAERQKRISGLAGMKGISPQTGLGGMGHLTGNLPYSGNDIMPNRPGSKIRPMTPTRQFLEKAGKDEYYQRQLNHNIINKMTKQMKSLPIFPHMEDGMSMASEQFGRPNSFRPGSASNPDFMLPRDVQFYYNNQDKISVKLDKFYESEKNSIEEMMDECLKRIITVFEDHKQNLYTTLQEDKATFTQIYTRFREGVGRFRKLAEDRLDENLKEYVTRIQKIRENDQNPMETEIEKLRLNKEMINSKEDIIREIKQSYEKSNIPRDKQSIGLLMIDEFKKKHELNVSTMAQRLQQIIGTLKGSIESFNNFQTYNALDKPESKEIKLHQDPMRASANAFGDAQKSLPGMGMTGVSPYMDPVLANAAISQMKASGMSHQMMINNLAQMGLAPGVMPTGDTYQMALWKQQMKASKDLQENTYDPAMGSGASPNLIGKNYEGPVFRPQINGNFNLNINAMQAHQSKWSPNLGRTGSNQRLKSPRSHLDKLNSALQGNGQTLRPVLKSAEKKMKDLEKAQAEGGNQMQSKKSVTFSLPNTNRERAEGNLEQETPQNREDQKRSNSKPDRNRSLYSNFNRINENPKKPDNGRGLSQNEEIDQVINKYKGYGDRNKKTSIDAKGDTQPEAMPEPIPNQERAKSPILKAKESIQKLNSYYNQMKNLVPTYRQENKDGSSFQHLRNKRGLNALRRTERDPLPRHSGSQNKGLLSQQLTSKTAGNTPSKSTLEKDPSKVLSEFSAKNRFGKGSNLASQLKTKNAYKKSEYGSIGYQNLKSKKRESDKNINDSNHLGEYQMPEGLGDVGGGALSRLNPGDAKVSRFSREMLQPKSSNTYKARKGPKKEVRNSDINRLGSKYGIGGFGRNKRPISHQVKSLKGPSSNLKPSSNSNSSMNIGQARSRSAVNNGIRQRLPLITLNKTFLLTKINFKRENFESKLLYNDFSRKITSFEIITHANVLLMTTDDHQLFKYKILEVNGKLYDEQSIDLEGPAQRIYQIATNKILVPVFKKTHSLLKIFDPLTLKLGSKLKLVEPTPIEKIAYYDEQYLFAIMPGVSDKGPGEKVYLFDLRYSGPKRCFMLSGNPIIDCVMPTAKNLYMACHAGELKFFKIRFGSSKPFVFDYSLKLAGQLQQLEIFHKNDNILLAKCGPADSVIYIVNTLSKEVINTIRPSPPDSFSVSALATVTILSKKPEIYLIAFADNEIRLCDIDSNQLVEKIPRKGGDLFNFRPPQPHFKVVKILSQKKTGNIKFVALSQQGLVLISVN